MAKRNRVSKWFKDGEKFVGVTHNAIDKLNRHESRKEMPMPRKEIGQMNGEVSIEARWLLITMAKKWNRKKPDEPFEYPIRTLAEEIGWSTTKVSKCIQELRDADILYLEPATKKRTRTRYTFNLDLMGVPEGNKTRIPNPVKRMV